MPQPAFEAMLGSLRGSAFESDRLALLRSVASTSWLTCKQLAAMLSTLNFENERIASAEIFASRIVDPQNHYTVLDALTFSDEKEKVQQILDRNRMPASAPPPPPMPQAQQAPPPMPQPQYAPPPPMPQAQQAPPPVPQPQYAPPPPMPQAQQAPLPMPQPQYAPPPPVMMQMSMQAPAGGAMPQQAFDSLMGSLRGAPFESDRMAIMRSVASANLFTCTYLHTILRELKFENERIAAAELFAPRIVDPQNHYTVLDALTFSDEKQKVQQILDRHRTPAAPQYSAPPPPMQASMSVHGGPAVSVGMPAVHMNTDGSVSVGMPGMHVQSGPGGVSVGMPGLSMHSTPGMHAHGGPAVSVGMPAMHMNTDGSVSVGMPGMHVQSGPGGVSVGMPGMYVQSGPGGVAVSGPAVFGPSVSVGMPAMTMTSGGYSDASMSVSMGGGSFGGAMADGAFDALLGQIKHASFESDRSAVIAAAAGSNMFRCEQVRRVAQALSFSNEKVGAVRTLASRIVDRENAFTILDAADFSSDREAMQQALSM
jgi:hypothetical protein